MEKSILRQHAKNLRKQSTDTERHLWYHLRANRLGFKFKRQVPMGKYIVDFVCLEKRLIIELDGSQHFNNQKYDMERTAWLNARGFNVLRFWNNDVLQKTSCVVEAIMQALSPTLSRVGDYHTVAVPSAGEGAVLSKLKELSIM